jgi:hypothetical protein
MDGIASFSFLPFYVAAQTKLSSIYVGIWNPEINAKSKMKRRGNI